jgi:WD40 repeat protein/serine/threonine protein kinase/formylglycine-generating enzyme required for sulfatase activity
MTATAPTDDRLDAVLAEYFQRLDRGEAISPTSLLAAHPDLSESLGEFFDAAGFIERLAGPTQSEQTQMLSANDTARSVLLGETIVSGVQAVPSRLSAKDGSLPQHFGRYEIIRLLGQGAMGAVYLAYDPSLQRQIAMKIPKFTDATSPDMSERFLREARSAAQLRHANICPVYDVGRIDGVHYITMAYIEGRTLAEELRAGRTFQPREIAQITRKLALALGKAHSAGVVHRDLKPGNIMLDPDGEPILMDFGLAYREETDELRLTKSGMIVGSPAYMSPEQIDGDGAKIGPASDIYSLGVVLYEMITGKLPFSGTMMSVIGQIASKEPTPVGQWRPELADSPLARLCQKMLAKRPQQRPATMQDVAAALDYVLSGLPDQRKDGVIERKGDGEALPTDVADESLRRSVAPSLRSGSPPHVQLGSPVSLPVKFPEAVLAQERRDRARMFLATTLILAALLGLFGALAGVVYIATDQGTLEITSHVDNVQIEVTSEDGVKVLDVDSGTTVHRLRSGDYKLSVAGDQTRLTLDKTGFKITRGGKVIVEAVMKGTATTIAEANLPHTASLAPERPAVRREPNHTGPKPFARLTDHTGSVRSAVFEPDGQHFITTGWDYTIRRWRLADRRQVGIIPTNGHAAYRSRLLPSGRLVTCGLDQTVRIWDIIDGRELQGSSRQSKPIVGLAITHDGKSALTGTWDGVLSHWNLDKLSDSRPIGADAGTVWDIAFSPDETQAAVADFRGPVDLWDVKKGERLAQLGKHEGGALAVAYFSEGKKLLSAGRDGKLKQWDVAARKLLREQSFPGVWIESFAISPDGQRVLVGLSAVDKVETSDPSAGQCVVLNLETWQEEARLPTGVPCVYATSFSPDGELLLAGGGQHGFTPDSAVCLWRLDEVRKPDAAPVEITTAERLFTGPSSSGFSIAASADGSQALVGHFRGGVSLWDVAQGKEIRKFTGQEKAVHRVLFWPDGKHVLAASEDATIRLWNLETAAEVRQFQGHTGRVNTLDLSRDGSMLLSASADYGQDRDNSVRLWDAATGRELRRFGQPVRYVRDVVFSLDGRRAFGTGAGLTSIIEWDVATGEPVHRFEETPTAPLSLAVSPDGSLLSAGYMARQRQDERFDDPENSVVRLWDLNSRSVVRELRGHTGPVGDLAFTPDGRLLLSTATSEHDATDQLVTSTDQTVRVWEVSTGREVARYQVQERVIQIAPCPDSQSFLTVGSSVRLWRLPESIRPQPEPATASDAVEARAQVAITEVRRLKTPARQTLSVAWTPDCRYAVASSNPSDNAVYVWDAKSGELVHRLKGHAGAVMTVAVSSDGTRVLSAGLDNSVRLWDLKSGEELLKLPATDASAAALSPDGRRALIGSRSGKLALWDLDKREAVLQLPGHNRWVDVVRFSKDGSRALTGSRDAAIGLWDLTTGRELVRLKGHASDVKDVTFMADETQALSASIDGTVRVWNLADGEQVQQIQVSKAWLYAAALLPGEHHVIAGAIDGTLGLWNVADGSRIAHVDLKPAAGVLGLALSGEQLLTAHADGSARTWLISPRVSKTPAPAGPDAAQAPFDAAKASQIQAAWAEHLGVPVEYTSPLGMKSRLIPPGEFDMGSSALEAARLQPQDDWFFAQWARDRRQKEMPQRRVRITRPFYLGTHEVTVAEFRRFIETSGYQTHAERDAGGGPGYAGGEWKLDKQHRWNSPGFDQGDDHPVVNLAWEDAAALCEWLSKQGHGAYRLPTEAEWEYACRAGTTTFFSSGDEPATLEGTANLADQSLAKATSQVTWHAAWDDQFRFTAPVGKLRPNAFGLCDMHGNASEWCLNWYGDYNPAMVVDPPGPSSGTRRVFRGGAFDNWAGFARSADRYSSHSPGLRTDWAGVRVVLSVEDVRKQSNKAGDAP